MSFEVNYCEKHGLYLSRLNHTIRGCSKCRRTQIRKGLVNHYNLAITVMVIIFSLKLFFHLI